ncbi:MAG TPA: hypothetical protein VJ692_11490, partial [Nitrospiraceae bacterium]|nr:hypothetical protein [Nitrospiraceae bacterium]
MQGIVILNDLSGSTIQVGGGLGNFFVGGSMSHSTVQSGGALNKFFVEGSMTSSTVLSGSIASIQINGPLSANSQFIAGVLPTTAIIDGGPIGRQLITVADDPRFITDTTAPALTAALKTDTGSVSTDKLTFDPTIVGSVADAGGLASFKA